MQLHFYKKIGVKPGFEFSVNKYGIGTVYLIRLWWSTITFSFEKRKTKNAKHQ